jgi:hypothetical protein
MLGGRADSMGLVGAVALALLVQASPYPKELEDFPALLKVVGETPLDSASPDGLLRILAMSPIGDITVFRVQPAIGGGATLVTKVRCSDIPPEYGQPLLLPGELPSPEPPRPKRCVPGEMVMSSSKRLTKAERASIEELATSALYSRPYRPPRADAGMINDGTNWFMEGIRGRRAHVILSAENQVVCALARLLAAKTSSTVPLGECNSEP